MKVRKTENTLCREARNARHSLAVATIVTLGVAATTTAASDKILPSGATACEADWISRTRFDSVTSVTQLKYWEALAEQGKLSFQLRLGLVRKSSDGQWKVPQDQSYSVKWLEKARAQNSKSAAWELAKINRVQLTHEAYLRSAMSAAEDEGNPWAATDLMNLTSGRWGEGFKPTHCEASLEIDKRCAPEDLLPISSARKWAEIAADGGNPAAQEWLCWSASDGNPQHGQPRDVAAAYKWCQIAVHSACNLMSVYRYLGTLKHIEGKSVADAETDRWERWERQPWRARLEFFFNPD